MINKFLFLVSYLSYYLIFYSVLGEKASENLAKPTESGPDSDISYDYQTDGGTTLQGQPSLAPYFKRTVSIFELSGGDISNRIFFFSFFLFLGTSNISLCKIIN